jgi:hypothetical protein
LDFNDSNTSGTAQSGAIELERASERALEVERLGADRTPAQQTRPFPRPMGPSSGLARKEPRPPGTLRPLGTPRDSKREATADTPALASPATTTEVSAEDTMQAPVAPSAPRAVIPVSAARDVVSNVSALQAAFEACDAESKAAAKEADTAQAETEDQRKDTGAAPAGLFLKGDQLGHAAMQPRRPVIGPLDRGQVSVVVAAPGGGKSTFATFLSVGVATGQSVFGMEVPEAGPVVIVSPEDEARVIGLRSIAAGHHIGADRELFMKNFHVFNCDIGTSFYHQLNGRHQLTSLGERLLEQTRALGVRMLVIDPLVEWHVCNENDNQMMHGVIADLRQFAKEADLHVMAIHHPAKADGFVTMASTRGAGAITAAARAVYALNPLSQDQVKRLGLAEEGNDDIVMVTTEKLSFDKKPAPFYLRRTSVKVAAGSAPVLTVLVPRVERATAEGAPAKTKR